MVSAFSAEKTFLLTLAACFALGCSSDDAAGTPAPGTDGGGQDAAQAEGGSPDSGGSGVTPAPDGEPYAALGQWHLFSDLKRQVPSARVIPYEVNAPLFTDYAYKRRFVYVPEGKTIEYTSSGPWAFPVGTILVKTFSYLKVAGDPSKGEQLLETRLLVHEKDGWAPHTYVYDDAQTEATRQVGGKQIDTTFGAASGETTSVGYLVPSANDCRSCHGKLGKTNTIGGKTLQLDRDNDYGDGPENQIDHLAKLGFFAAAPEAAADRVHLVDPFVTGDLNTRVRSYLDSNCAHCHRPGDAPGSLSGLWLNYDSTDPSQSSANWGVCKQPASAGGATCGNKFGVVPGDPDHSIIICRLESELAKVMMPPVGRTLVHAEGVALLREWIEKMPGSCDAPTPDAGPPDAGPPAPDASTPDASTPDASAPAADASTDAGPG